MTAMIKVVDLITTDEDRRFAPAGHLAEAILDVTAVSGICRPADIEKRGFTPDEVAKHWDMALALAAVETKLMRQVRPNLNTFFRGQ